jgi:hypothetical protein
LDQLERRHCKDTPFFRPFYIGAPKGPFLPGLKSSLKDTYLELPCVPEEKSVEQGGFARPAGAHDGQQLARQSVTTH